MIQIKWPDGRNIFLTSTIHIINKFKAQALFPYKIIGNFVAIHGKKYFFSILREQKGIWGHCSFRLCISAELHSLLLFHSSSPVFLYPIPPSLLPRTTLSELSGCPHASLPDAAGVLSVTLHYTPLYLLWCVCVCVCAHVWETGSWTVELCMHVQNLCVHLYTRMLNTMYV